MTTEQSTKGLHSSAGIADEAVKALDFQDIFGVHVPDANISHLYQRQRLDRNSPTEIDTKSGSIIERCKKGSVLHKKGSENEPSGCRDDPGCFFARSNET